jgi:hypothetical protein
MNSRVKRFVKKHQSDPEPPVKFTINGRRYLWADVTKKMGIAMPNKDIEVTHEPEHDLAETQPTTEDQEPGSRTSQGQE